ncbi:MAG: hypothetical protein KBC38_01230 [Candidatus Pacebacteria bacterium]|nr:hypothetical protein [Candidatus Paceibacterota bacterium]MBP9840258.1 hypothetical protein [Candidatus Paceibacterota bacterium]
MATHDHVIIDPRSVSELGERNKYGHHRYEWNADGRLRWQTRSLFDNELYPLTHAGYEVILRRYGLDDVDRVKLDRDTLSITGPEALRNWKRRPLWTRIRKALHLDEPEHA